MIPNLKPSDFNISGKPIPETVADRIVEWHINPLNVAQNHFYECISVSENSGWRPRWWELAHNRNGSSQHCYGQKKDNSFDQDAKGATDITCEEFEKNKWELLDKLIEHTDYTRFCMYDGFIHADYKATEGNKRQLFNYGYDVDKEKWKWKFEKFV